MGGGSRDGPKPKKREVEQSETNIRRLFWQKKKVVAGTSKSLTPLCSAGDLSADPH